MSITQSSKEALMFLNNLKPYDRWSIETHSSTKEVRLLRRSVALTDNYFRDIHYDPISGNVIGILTKGPPAKGQVLVDSSGRPTGKTPAIVFVTTWKGTTAAATTPRTPASRSVPPPGLETPDLSDAQNKELIKYAAYVIGSAIVLKTLLNAFFLVYLILFPAVFLYAVQTCPSEESFDAKKELKRVLRGHHLPDTDPQKPKGWLSEAVARVQASVTTELATGLGYEISIMNVIGALLVASVSVPAVNRGYIWIGVFGKWTYIYSRELESNPQVST